MKLSKRQLKRIIREEYSRLNRTGLITEAYDLESIRNTHEMTKSEAWMEGWDDAVYNHQSDFEDDAYDPDQFGGDQEAAQEYMQGYDQGEDDYEEINDIEY